MIRRAGDDGPSSDDPYSDYVYDPTEQASAQDLEPAHVAEQSSPTSEHACLCVRGATTGGTVTVTRTPLDVLGVYILVL